MLPLAPRHFVVLILWIVCLILFHCALSFQIRKHLSLNHCDDVSLTADDIQISDFFFFKQTAAVKKIKRASDKAVNVQCWRDTTDINLYKLLNNLSDKQKSLTACYRKCWSLCPFTSLHPVTVTSPLHIPAVLLLSLLAEDGQNYSSYRGQFLEMSREQTFMETTTTYQ